LSMTVCVMSCNLNQRRLVHCLLTIKSWRMHSYVWSTRLRSMKNLRHSYQMQSISRTCCSRSLNSLLKSSIRGRTDAKWSVWATSSATSRPTNHLVKMIRLNDLMLGPVFSKWVRFSNPPWYSWKKLWTNKVKQV
jgi:hypothetical protein